MDAGMCGAQEIEISVSVQDDDDGTKRVRVVLDQHIHVTIAEVFQFSKNTRLRQRVLFGDEDILADETFADHGIEVNTAVCCGYAAD